MCVCRKTVCACRKSRALRISAARRSVGVGVVFSSVGPGAVVGVAVIRLVDFVSRVVGVVTWEYFGGRS